MSSDPSGSTASDRFRSVHRASDQRSAPAIQAAARAYRHPQVRANEAVIEHDHPQAGRIRQARTPALFSGTLPEPPRPARRLGEDTRAVLAEAGYDAETITDMIAQGIATDTQEGSP